MIFQSFVTIQNRISD